VGFQPDRVIVVVAEMEGETGKPNQPNPKACPTRGSKNLRRLFENPTAATPKLDEINNQGPLGGIKS
jgi:hypothetical protein